jgi:hypothetical protein
MVAVMKQASRSQPIMRLVRDEDYAEEQHRRERRIFPRREVKLTVAGKRLDHSVLARRQPALVMDVRDLSVGGLSALTETPLLAGELIAVSFPTEGLKMGWSACGRVVRCSPSALGYRVAVEFESIPSAA